MRIIDLIHHLLPAGTDAAYLVEPPTTEVLNRPGGVQATFPSYSLCPIWPPDLFAVVGTLIDRSSCYTEASPDREDLPAHDEYLENIVAVAASWGSMVLVPDEVQELWHMMVSNFGMVPLTDVCRQPDVVGVLLALFAIADEASAGMGWDKETPESKLSTFSLNVMKNALTPPESNAYRLPYWPISLCGMVSPNHVIVLPKSITTTKGCTIRSLSHHLALLPCRTTLEPSWFLVSRPAPVGPADEMRLLLVPFPYSIPDESFKLAFPRTPMSNNTSYAAFFQLRQAG